ncbi:retrovirus-related pol polyprotein from transposon TNT 1-94 [Tanacetum coccineum]
MVLMVERNRGEHLIRRFAGRGNEPDPRDVKIASLKQRIQELEFPQLQQDSPAEEAETESNVWDDGSEDVNPFGGGNPGFHDDHYDNPLLTKETESEPIIWDIGDEEEEYPFVNKYPSFQEEPIVLVEEESCLVYDTDNEEEESMPVYDTDIEDVIEEEEGFVGKGGFGGEEDNIEDVVVVANDLCSSMIQTILSVNFEKDINTKSHELMSERIHDISYIHVFGCPVFIHNHKDHLGKFDAKADDGYFLGYSFVSKAFRVFNTRRQQVEETYHVTFDESMEAIRFTNTSQDEIGFDDSSRYPPDEFLHEDDPSRQYQVDSDVSYYVIPPDLHSLNLPKKTMSLKMNKSLPNPQKDNRETILKSQRKLMNLQFLMSISLTYPIKPLQVLTLLLRIDEPKKIYEALNHPGWVNAMQEDLNQFYRNKVWTRVPLPYGRIAIGSKWVFRNKKGEHGIITKNKARLVAQGYSQEEGIVYDETFAPVARMEAIRIFLAFATYMNFIVIQLDVKSTFLNRN